MRVEAWFSLSLLLVPIAARAQTEFWREDFDNGCAALCPGDGYSGINGPWSVTDVAPPGADANIWYVSCTENGAPEGSCGVNCSGDATLHVANVSTSPAAFLFCPPGDCGAAYDTSGPTVVASKRIESSVIDTTGLSSISARFLFLGEGQACADAADFVVSLDGGLGWQVVASCLRSNNAGCGTQGRWEERIVDLPAGAAANPNLRVGFHWRNNDDFVGNDPSFAVDQLVLRHGGGCVVAPLPRDLGNHLRGVKAGGDAAFAWTLMGPVAAPTTHFHVYRSLAKGQPFPSGWTLIAGDAPPLVAQTHSDPVVTDSQAYFYDVRSADDCENLSP